MTAFGWFAMYSRKCLTISFIFVVGFACMPVMLLDADQSKGNCQLLAIENSCHCWKEGENH